MALNLQSLSISSVFNSIINFFKSQENNTKWRDMSTGSEGSFLVRLLSNVFSAISYRIVAQSRENFISTAALPSSNIGISQNLGYSPFRGTNLKRKINLTPLGDYTFPKLSVIGIYNDLYDIITLEETALKEGVAQDINVVVGRVKEETFTCGTSAIKVFSLFTTGISEDYVLYLGSQEVPTTKVIKELIYDKYLVRTNPYKSVDVLYLNTYDDFKYKYGTDSEITIRYVELADVDVVPFTNDMFSYGTLNDYTTVSTYLPFESVESMKVNAPLDHELQNIIRSKPDYANRLSELVPSVIDVSFEALTPTYTLISYLKNDFTLLTNSEKETVKGLLRQENFFGTPLPDITYPRRDVAKLNINIALKNKYHNISDIQEDINNLLSNYSDISLDMSFNTYDFERQIEELSYVKYARVSYDINERAANTNYQIGYIVTYGDNSYMASQILGSTGYEEPLWNVPVNPGKEIDTGLETIDGNLVWRAYKLLPNMPPLSFFEWSANSQFGIGEYCYTSAYPNYMFKCVDIIRSSGATSPDVTSLKAGDFIVDGGVVWVVKDYIEADLWGAYTNYRLGDSCNVATSDSKLSLECISYTGTSGTVEEFEFELPVYPILSSSGTSFTVTGDKTFYLRKGDTISVSYSGGYSTFSIKSSIYDGGNNTTIVTVNQVVDTTLDYEDIFGVERGTRDGQILWKLLSDTSKVDYGWNTYVTFDYSLNIIGD